MQLRRLSTDDDAVSPIIGVVLLVGIVVASMAILLLMIQGGGPFEQSPDADLVYSEGPDGNVTIAVASARGLTETNTHVRLENGDVCDGIWEGSDTLEPGMAETIAVDACGAPLQEDDTLQVIWSSSSGGLLLDTYQVRGGQLEVPYFLVTDIDTNTPVTEGETLTVTAEIENVGGDDGTQDVTIEVNGEQVTEQLDLDEHESDDITLEWDTDEGDAGDYEAEVSTDNDSQTVSVTVEKREAGEPEATLEVEIVGTNSTVVEGETLTVDAEIENTGDEAATQTIVLEDFNAIEVDDKEVTIDGGETESVRLIWTTEDGDAGSGDVTVASEDTSDTELVEITEDTEVVFAVNAGGEEYTAEDGTIYSADTNFDGGDTHSNESIAIDETDDDPLYQSERFGDFSYDVPVEDGTYEVTLHFAEIWWDVEEDGGEGTRVFDVTIEGEDALTEYDIYAEIGKLTATQKTFTGDVEDGELNLEFDTIEDNAKISAIKVTETEAAAAPEEEGPTVESVQTEPTTVGDGETVTVTATVDEGSDPVDSVIADTSAFGGPADLELTESGGVYEGSFTVNGDDAVGEGQHQITVTATDADGRNDAAATNGLRLGLVPPEIVFVDPTAGMEVTDDRRLVTATVTDGVGVDEDSIRVTVEDADGLVLDAAGIDHDAVSYDDETLEIDVSQTSQESYADGEVHVTIEAADRVGNDAEETLAFTVDAEEADEEPEILEFNVEDKSECDERASGGNNCQGNANIDVAKFDISWAVENADEVMITVNDGVIYQGSDLDDSVTFEEHGQYGEEYTIEIKAKVEDETADDKIEITAVG